MRTSTSPILRGLCMALVLAGIAGTAHAQRTVTLRLNTATLPDTTQTVDGIQVRGCLTGCTGDQSTLPGDDIIAWNDNTTLRPDNEGGDYWTTTFQVPDSQQLEFKFFSPQAEAVGVGGWEDGSNHTLAAGEGDTTLTLHFYEKNPDKAYDWRPYEQKEDSIAIWFRVYMATETGFDEGYDPDNASQQIGVRGAPAKGGPLDWGATNVILERESDNEEHPGYHLFSGAAYYPATAADTVQKYKFFITGVPNGWEEGISDREFTIPDSDTTLHWVYFADSAPVDVVPERDTSLVTFEVEVTPLEEAGLFVPARADSIQIRGGFNGWNDDVYDDSRLLPNFANAALWQNEVPVTGLAGDTLFYKYFLVQGEGGFIEGDAGYEEPLDYGGGNRVFFFPAEQSMDLGTDFYNNIRAGNVIPEGTDIEVTFQVDMAGADTFVTAFDPETDGVRLRFEDGIWRGTQAIAKGGDDEDPEILFATLSDEDGDMIYTGTYTVAGPTYNGIGYVIEYGNDTDGWTREIADPQGIPGRRRYQYVLPGEGGTFPATYTMPEVWVKSTFPLPFECNPTLTAEELDALPASVTDVCYPAGEEPQRVGVEPIDDVLPKQIALDQNYPNPFNPTTSFEYSLDQTVHVRVRVFDVMGRVVATLVDGVQPASTYKVTFDASHLSSGVYFYQLETPAQVLTRKMTLLK